MDLAQLDKEYNFSAGNPIAYPVDRLGGGILTKMIKRIIISNNDILYLGFGRTFQTSG